VEEGLLRAKVVLADGREYIKEFYWEGDEFLDFHHLLSGEPARYSVEALEPCRLQLLPLADLRRLPAGPPGITISLKCNCASRRRKSCCC
jgi:CRP-like cAMP-binding protein